MKLAVVVGTRPEIIKMQPVLKEILNKDKHELVFIHTGQHSDFRMSDIFIHELGLEKPRYFLNVSSTSQAVQTGMTIIRCEEVLKTEEPDYLLVEGDTNSGLGASIASAKLGVPVGHIEAGCRSFDKLMPEEINRVLISDIAQLHFAPTSNCVENLLREGIGSYQIFLTGHPIVDLLNELKGILLSQSNIANSLSLKDGLSNKSFALLTVHRRENIANKERIDQILNALSQLSKKIPVVFPCHPHTRSQLNRFSLMGNLRNVQVVEPVGYIESLSLIKHARFVLTDSGGIQQEAALLGTPCVTLREVTEWVDTVSAGVNFLSGWHSWEILRTVEDLEKNYDEIVSRFDSMQKLFGDVGVSKRIISIIEKGIQAPYGFNH